MKLLRLLLVIYLLSGSGILFSQRVRFNLILSGDENGLGTIADIKQDPQGYLWLSTALKGLQRFDGTQILSYTHDPYNPNSLSKDRVPCMQIDSSGIIWAATYGGGLDRFDPTKNMFTHFRHKANDPSSLANDTAFVVLRDHLGALWVGTYGGLDRLDEKTGKFTHFRNIASDPSSLSYNHIWNIYEDREGTLWIGCGSPFFNVGESSEEGGLNRFNREHGNFTRYLHDPKDASSIASNKVRAIFEDSKGHFWIGSTGDGLQIMDRKTGRFTHYYYDPLHPEKLSRPPLGQVFPNAMDHITFINEDLQGSIWIGSFGNGVNRYDPVTNQVTHFGFTMDGARIISSKDTSGGFHEVTTWRFFSSRDGLFWLSTANGGNLYNVDLDKTVIPYFKGHGSPSFYYDGKKNILWMGTIKGLVQKDLNTSVERSWTHDPLHSNSLCNDTIYDLKADDRGNLWLATQCGLSRFDINKEEFTAYRHDGKNPASISSDYAFTLCVDHNKNIWVSTPGWRIDKMDPSTGRFTSYIYSSEPNTIGYPIALSMAEDSMHNIWIGSTGLFKMVQQTGKFYQYLESAAITSICTDKNGVVWAGSDFGLFRHDEKNDRFVPFLDPNDHSEIKNIVSILEDSAQNLWVTTINGVFRINSKRDELKPFGASYGLDKKPPFFMVHNSLGSNGEIYLADQDGYYVFPSQNIKGNGARPVINFTGLKIGDKELNAATGRILKEPLEKATEIKLSHDQNTFSFDFFAIDFRSPGEVKYLFMLENYDDDWHYTGADHRAYFFNVPPGNYLFKVKAINVDGNYSERSMSVIISPPWWRTWWAYTMYAVLFLLGVVVVNRFMRNRVIEKEKAKTRERELAQAKEIEKAYHELKLTQAQLIQSEKMASLGELTAGIAHEIQNPLNFVNNFSDVNTELIDEAEQEMEKGNISEAKSILSDVRDNEQKINHHGKRADSIVKGMLQHSRTSTGIKEPTDINKLADEYLRLAYHGLRAKDKSFNAKIETDLDNSVAKIDIVPQEIGRVLLNLINNAFYAVNEKTKLLANSYEPFVKLTTRKLKDKIEIRVVDNGNGIPKNIADKIFQPFFTTKPTGQGTGLGLSLAYDIVKAHGGEIKVNANEGEGSEFIIQLSL